MRGLQRFFWEDLKISVMVTGWTTIYNYQISASDQFVVDVDFNGFSDAAVQSDDGAATELQQVADFDRRFAQHRFDINSDS